MKRSTSLLLRSLCLALTLCVGFGALSVTALAAANNAVPPANEIVNKYNRRSPNAKISVQPGDIVYAGPTICWSGTTFLKAYDASGNATNITPGANGVQLAVDFGYYGLYAYTVPQGVTAVSGVVSARNGEIPYQFVYTVTVNQRLTKQTFNEYWEATDKTSLDRLGKLQTVRTDLSLHGRSALFIGDSITHASRDDSTYHHSWAGRIGDVNEMTYINAGSDGASVSWRKAENHMELQLNRYKSRKFDYVIMWGGINDAHGAYTIGTVSASKDPTTFASTDTFIGALEHFFYQAKQNYPDAELGYIINFPVTYATGSTANFNIPAWGNYVTKAIEVCNKWEVPYLDLYHDTDYCNNVLKINTTELLPDNLHPNGQAYDLLYLKIQAWMDTLDPLPPAPPAEPEDTTPVDTTPADTTTAAPETTTTAATPAESTGCGASISAATAILTTTALSGAAVCLTKKDKKKRK